MVLNVTNEFCSVRASSSGEDLCLDRRFGGQEPSDLASEPGSLPAWRASEPSDGALKKPWVPPQTQSSWLPAPGQVVQATPPPHPGIPGSPRERDLIPKALNANEY